MKVFNLLKALAELVAAKGAAAPYVIPIGERADQITKPFRDGQLNTQEALAELEHAVREYRAVDGRELSDLPAEGFAALLLLRRNQAEDADRIAKSIAEALARFPHWRQAIYKALVDGDFPVDRVVARAGRIGVAPTAVQIRSLRCKWGAAPQPAG